MIEIGSYVTDMRWMPGRIMKLREIKHGCFYLDFINSNNDKETTIIKLSDISSLVEVFPEIPCNNFRLRFLIAIKNSIKWIKEIPARRYANKNRAAILGQLNAIASDAYYKYDEKNSQFHLPDQWVRNRFIMNEIHLFAIQESFIVINDDKVGCFSFAISWKRW